MIPHLFRDCNKISWDEKNFAFAFSPLILSSRIWLTCAHIFFSNTDSSNILLLFIDSVSCSGQFRTKSSNWPQYDRNMATVRVIYDSNLSYKKCQKNEFL